MKIETKCIQSGYTPENGEPRVLPIYQSTTWKYGTTEQMGKLFDLEESGYFYTRLANPQMMRLPQKLPILRAVLPQCLHPRDKRHASIRFSIYVRRATTLYALQVYTAVHLTSLA